MKITDRLTVTIDCYHFDRISILKYKILEKEFPNQQQFKSTLQQLTFSGQPLQELGRTLKDYKIGRESTLGCKYKSLFF